MTRSAVPHALAGLALDAFLLARFGPSEGRPDGRAWERAGSGLLQRPGLPRRQHAGTLGLFGRGSASGARHELDGAGEGADAGVWLECKAREAVAKPDVATFAFKCFDLYRAAAAADPDATGAARWWPVLVSSEPVVEGVRRMCASEGIVLCDPAMVPLVVLMRAASRPSADEYLPEVHLSELARLGANATAPMQERWRINSALQELRLRLKAPDARAIGDVLFLQNELSSDFLDAFEVNAPGSLERRAASLADRMLAATLSV